MRSRRVLRRRAAATVLALLLVPLAGCGSESPLGGLLGGDSADDGAGLGLSEGDTLTSREFRGIAAKGYVASGTAHMVLTNRGVGRDGRAEGDVDYGHGKPRFSLVFSGRDVGVADSAELRVVGRTGYMKIPGRTRGRFVALDAREPDVEELVRELDPRSNLESLVKGAQRIAYEGDQQVRGEKQDGFRMIVRKRDIEDRLGLEPRTLRRLPTRLTWFVWFDEQQRLRRITTELGGRAGTLELRLERHGKDVDIRKPPPGQVLRAGGARG